jgi:hypothetical protein
MRRSYQHFSPRASPSAMTESLRDGKYASNIACRAFAIIGARSWQRGGKTSKVSAMKGELVAILSRRKANFHSIFSDKAAI